MYLNVADAQKMTATYLDEAPLQSAPGSVSKLATNTSYHSIPRMQTRSTQQQQAQNVNAPDIAQASVIASPIHKRPLETEIQDEPTNLAKRRRIRLIGTESHHDIRFITRPTEPAKLTNSAPPIERFEEHVEQAAYDQNLLKEIEDRFESAIQKGDVATVEKYLETGRISLVNSAQSHLLSAVCVGRFDIVRLMLQYLPPMQKPINLHLLIESITRGNVAIFDAFLHKDAIYPEPGKDNPAVTFNPQELKLLLGAVVQSGNTDILKLLMRRGLVTDPANRDVVATAIHMAVNSGKYALLKMLLAETGRLNFRWLDEKLNWLKAAIKTGCAFTLRKLVEKIGRDYYSKVELDEHLIFAVENNYVKGAETLIEMCNADVAVRDVKGRTQLMKAAVNGSVEMCRLLFYHQAPTDDIDLRGNTVLMYAVVGGNMNIVDGLINVAVDLRAKNHNGQTVLDILELMLQSSDVMANPEKSATLRQIKSLIKNMYDIPLSVRRAAYNFDKF